MILRPRVTKSGRYDSRHLANAGFRMAGDALVITDARGNEHRFPCDGTDRAPAAIGLIGGPRMGRDGPSLYVAVVDGCNRLLAYDPVIDLWCPDDVQRFAESAGLHVRDVDDSPAMVGHGPGPVDISRVGSSTAIAVLLALIPAGVAAALLGAPAWLAIAIAPVAAIAYGGWILSRRRPYEADGSPGWTPGTARRN